MAFLDEMADEIALAALQDEERSGDEMIVTRIGEVLGASSQTLQEAYLTAVRVRRAEKRAKEILAERKAQFEAKQAKDA